MANLTGLLFFSLFALALLVLIPLLIGTYVYKDAKSRNMDAVLWTFVAVLIPSFVGLIIYLVIRSNNPNQNCPSCKRPIAAEYILCPYCGVALKATCPSCAASVDEGWKLCPKCGTELPKQTHSSAEAVKPARDRKLAITLAAAIAVPVLLFALAVGGFTVFRSSEAISTMQAFNLVGEEAPEAVRNWTEQCDLSGEGVYVLKYTPKEAGLELGYVIESGKAAYAIYVYINEDKGKGLEKDYAGSASFDKGSLVISYAVMDVARGKGLGYELSNLGVSGYNLGKLKILVNGKEVKYSLKELE